MPRRRQPALVLAAAAALAASLAAAPVRGQGAPPSLAPPTRLTTEYLPSPAMGVGVARPRFTFAIEHDEQGVVFSGYRVVVRGWAGDTVWDSHDVAINQSQFSGVRCGATLAAGQSYTWAASWASSDGRLSAFSEPSHFDIGLLRPQDWAGAKWVGAGHDEFKTEFELAGAALGGCGGLGRARLYMSSPGGAVATINGAVVGNDTVGIAGWLDWTKSMCVYVCACACACACACSTASASNTRLRGRERGRERERGERGGREYAMCVRG